MSHPEIRDFSKLSYRKQHNGLLWQASTQCDEQRSELVCMCQALGDKRRGAVEVKRGGALLGGQQTKRAWNLRFLSRLELSDTDTHTHCMFICQQPYMTHVDEDVLCFWLSRCVKKHVCGQKSLHAYCTHWTWTANRFSFTQVFLSPQRKSTVWVFQSRPETIAPFTKAVGAWGGGVRRIRETERGREGKSAASHWPLTVPIHCRIFHNTLLLEHKGRSIFVASSRSADVNRLFKLLAKEKEKGKPRHRHPKWN